jgi:hypothetical protein
MSPKAMVDDEIYPIERNISFFLIESFKNILPQRIRTVERFL